MRRSLWWLVLCAGAWCVAPSGAVSLNFSQIDWLDGLGGYVNYASDWGQVRVQFGPGDLGLLTPAGDGSYFGFVNVVTSVPGGSSSNWAVRNLVLSYNGVADLSTALPESVPFDLGVTPGGSHVSSLTYNFTVDSAPRATAPSGSMSSATVDALGVFFGAVGTPLGGDGSGWSNLALSHAFNFVGAAPGSTLADKAKINVADISVAAVDEGKNGCAPGAAARSLKYLGIAPDAQTAYGTLADPAHMNTSPVTGTTWQNYQIGKTTYGGVNTVWNTDIASVIASLKAGADVEMWVSWGRSNPSDPNSDRGGHCAFVGDIKVLKDGSGNITGYQITYYDDQTQGDGAAGRDKHSVTVKPDGTLDGYGAFSKLWGFYVETVPPPPPPCKGDSNCDRVVSWRDIDFFVAAQNDAISAWYKKFLPGTPSCSFLNNDIGGASGQFVPDGHVSWRDINGFVQLMNMSCPHP